MNGPKDLFAMSGVSKNWFRIFASPHRWTHMVRKGYWQIFLVHPDFSVIIQSFAAQDDLQTLAGVLMEYCKDQEGDERFDSISDSLILSDGPFLMFVFGSLRRIQVLWKHLPNKNPLFNLGGNNPDRKFRYWFLTHFYSLLGNLDIVRTSVVCAPMSI